MNDDFAEARGLTANNTGCCSTCNNSPCGCPQTPYYEKAACCPEDNRQYVDTKVLVGSVKNAQDFSMPACGAQLRVRFNYVGDFPTGSWLWASGYGFLTIVNYNAITEELTLRNDCPAVACNVQTQASPGTPIPACTVWTLTVPQCPAANGNTASTYPYLNAGFTAPVSAACIDITLTNVNGLSVGKNISILNGLYRISAIKTATVITICNDGGLGITPGTSVDYKVGDALVIPIVLIDSNPCLTPPATSGKLLVCDVNVIKPLVGNADGQIPVFSLSTGKINFRTVSNDVLNCTVLLDPVTVDPSFSPSTNYLARVEATSDFTATQVVTISGVRFTVFSIINATNMRVTVVTPPGSVTVFPVGAAVCSVGCCEQLRADVEPRLDILEFADTVLRSNVRNDQSTSLTTGSITIGQTINGNEVFTDVVNNSPTKAMNVLVHFRSEAMFTVNGVAGNYAQVSVESRVAASINPVIILSLVASTARSFTIPAGLTAVLQSIPVEFTGAYIIPAGQTWRFRSNIDLIFGAGNATTITPVLNGISNKIALIAVSEL